MNWLKIGDIVIQENHIELVDFSQPRSAKGEAVVKVHLRSKLAVTLYGEEAEAMIHWGQRNVYDLVKAHNDHKNVLALMEAKNTLPDEVVEKVTEASGMFSNLLKSFKDL